MKSRISLFAFASAIILSMAAPLHAATYNWNGSTTGGATGASNTWDTATANWTGTGTIWPAASTLDDDATFGGTAGIVTISGGVTANDLTFNTTGYTIADGTLTLNGTAAPVITNAVTAEISSSISGSAGFTKRSTGTLILSGSNTLSGSLIAGLAVGTGPTYVSDGIIRLTNAKATGSTTVVVNGGYQSGRIELSGGIAISNAITLQGRQGPTYAAISNFSGDNIVSGAINVQANGARLNFNSAAGNLTVSGAAMTGSNGRTLTFRGAGNGEFAKPITVAVVSSVDKQDAGTWTISGASTYTGATTVNGGKLIVTGPSGLGTGATANASVAANAALDYAAKTDAPLVIGGTLTVTGGTNSAVGGSIGSTTTSASINVTGAATITDAAHSVNIYGISGVSATNGTYTLISGGAGSSLNPATAPTLGKVCNNTSFTVGALSRTATTLNVAITAATPLATAYWTGGLSGAPNIWSVSDGATTSNWTATAGGAAQALVPGATTNVIISATSPAVAPTSTVLGANMSINGLTISDTTNGLGLNSDTYTLTLASGGITMDSAVPASNITAKVALDAAQTWTNNSINNLTVSGTVSGTSVLTTGGTGTVVLSATNTYTGDTRVAAGTLALANLNAIATSTLDMNTADAGSVSFAVAGTNTYNIGGLSGTRAINAGGNTLSVGANNVATEYSGELSNGALTKVGTNTLTLSGSNTFAGNVVVNAGRLTLGNSGALGTGPKGLNMQGTGRTVYLKGGIAIPSNITFNLSSNSFDGGGLNNESEDNSILGPINITSGNPALNISSASGALTISGNLTLTATGRPLLLGGDSSGENTISGVIGSSSAEVLPVTKQGAGKWILSGTNTYTGATTISGGTLLVNGSIAAASAVAVNSGVLGGTGVVGGAVTVAAAGTVAPGVSTGALVVGSADFSAGGTLAIDIDDSATPKADALNVTGVLNVSNAFLNIIATGTPSQASYVIATAGSVSGTFPPASVTGIPAGYSLVYSATDIRLAASSTPFQSWMATNFPTVTPNTPEGDPDGDGVNNLAEFAFSGNPGDPANNGLKRYAIANISGTDYLTYTFACRSGATFTGSGPANASQDGVDYSVRASLDLSTFTLGVDEVSPAITTGLPTAPAGYTYRTFRVTDARTAHSAAFIQVKTSPTAP